MALICACVGADVKVGRPRVVGHFVLNVDAVLGEQVDASRAQVAHLERPVPQELTLDTQGVSDGIRHFLIGDKG